MEITEKLKSDYTKAKIALMRRADTIFLTTILFSLKSEWSENIPTACVDGVTMQINPQFFDSLNHDEKQTLLAHEAWHVGFNHMSRSEGLDAMRFNQAADHVINLQLKGSRFKPLDGWLCDPKYSGMTTRQVYDLLEAEEQRSGQPSPSDALGQDVKPIDGKAADAGTKKQEIKETITRANTAKELADKKGTGKKAGNLPGEVTILIDEYLNPILPWQVILQNYMTEYDKSDYSYQRPNKRFMPDFYLPSLFNESMAEIALAFDVSCSVTNYELKQYHTEVEDIIKKLEPMRTTIAAFDHRLQNVVTLEKGQSIKGVPFTGRGGTCLEPVFEYYRKHKPTVLIVFSDLECDPIPLADKPDFDVIWICVSNSRAKVEFGKLIHVDLGNPTY
jgi:predicted metal-dependent peptidase